MYNNGLLINANCRTKDALEYIQKEFQKLSQNLGSMAYDETDRWLDSLFTGTSVISVNIYFTRKPEVQLSWDAPYHLKLPLLYISN